MKKIIYKLIVITMLSVFILSLTPLFSLADDTDPVSSADNFLDSANSKFGLNGNKLKNASDDIYNMFSCDSVYHRLFRRKTSNGL